MAAKHEKIPKRFKLATVTTLHGLGVSGWWMRPVRGDEAWWAFGPYKSRDHAVRAAERKGLRVKEQINGN